MKKFITEHQSSHLDLTTEVSDILYRGHSDFQDIVVADSKEFGACWSWMASSRRLLKMNSCTMKASSISLCSFIPIPNGPHHRRR